MKDDEYRAEFDALIEPISEEMAARKVLAYIRYREIGPWAGEANRPEDQREQIQQYAGRLGYTIVAVAEDLDIGSAGSPFARWGLGPWLTDPTKISQWDTLVITNFDRVSRDFNDINQLEDWLTTKGKTLETVGGLRFPRLGADCPAAA